MTRITFIVKILSVLLCFAGVCDCAENGTASVVQITSTGHGDPLLLIPGLGCDPEIWDGTVAHLRSRFRCQVVSIAGFSSAPPVSDFSLDRIVDEVLAYLDANREKEIAVIGHSLGGFLALKLAIARPEAVSRLIIVDAAPCPAALYQPDLTPDRARAQAEFLRQLTLGQSAEEYRKTTEAKLHLLISNPEAYNRVVNWTLASDRKTVAEALAETLSSDLRPVLGKIRASALVLGSWIGFKPFGLTKEMVASNLTEQYKALKNARIEISDSAGHFIMLDDPGWFEKRVDDFLGR